MEAAGSPRILQVAIPIFENVTALDFVGPYEPLHHLPNVNVVFVSHRKGLYKADGGMLSFQATATFDEVPSPDVIVVPGGDGTNALMADKPILDWIRKVEECISISQAFSFCCFLFTPFCVFPLCFGYSECVTDGNPCLDA